MALCCVCRVRAWCSQYVSWEIGCMDALPITPHIIEYWVAAGGWGGGVYLEKWGTRPETTKVSIRVIKYGEKHKNRHQCSDALRTRWLMPNSTSILRPSSNFLSTLFTQMGNEKNLGWGEVMRLRCNWDLFSFGTFYILLLMINAVISCLWTFLGVGSRFSPSLLILKRISHGKHQRAPGGKCKNIYWAASEVEEDIFHPL